ncbi:MAG: ribonuclease D [Glaciecola sp.]|jgi:ribonuclease D
MEGSSMEIKYINTNDLLKSCIAEISSNEQIALDLEFDKNLHRYGFNICLIQIQAGATSYLIDPLVKEMDYKQIFPLLEDPEIEKVVFAFGEDLRLLNSLSCFPKNIYDLNIATKLLDFEPGSLSRYLNEVLDLEIAKSAQLSNWFTRPLTSAQTVYAAGDVQYLLALREVLNTRAGEKSMIEWIDEENAFFDTMKFEIDYSKAFIKEKDKKGFTEFQWHIYQKLLGKREVNAKKINRPSFQVMDTNFIKDMVHNKTILEEWDLKKGAHRSLKNQVVKDELLNIYEEAENEAQNLSKTKWAKNKLDRINYVEHMDLKKKIEALKKEYFKPIQSLVKRDYGLNASTFILSNKLIADIITNGGLSIPEYKKRLFAKYAIELNMDLTKFQL